jgi:DNA polymerase-3 subunit epsilon
VVADSVTTMATTAVQTTLADLGTPLRDVTFCVVDLETTGGRADDLGITEIGAVRVRGGEILGEFQSLVNPGVPIPAFISMLTGITDARVAGAPRLTIAYPALLEFLTGAVLVAHNAPYDLGYLRAAAVALDYPWPNPTSIDTAVLARRILPRGEVPNNKLATLAQHFRAGTRPTHRALDDARATVDVLHSLLERVGSLGVHSLEELLGYSGRVTTQQRRKRHLADDLPACPGVYIFLDDRGESLYVGTSRNIRTRVRTYFTASERRSRMAEMVGLATTVTPIPCASPLEAAVRELRLIAERKPRYNRRSRHPERAWWLKLTAEHAPRLSLVRTIRDDVKAGARYIGPMPRRAAMQAAEVVAMATSLRTCTSRLSESSRETPCALAELGRCSAPCSGPENFTAYQLSVAAARAALGQSPSIVTSAVMAKIRVLSDREQFEEAAQLRDRWQCFLRASERAQNHRALAATGQLVAAEPADHGGWTVHVIRHGRLAGVASCARGADPRATVAAAIATAEHVEPPTSSLVACLPAEADLILGWLEQPGIRLVSADHGWCLPRDGAGRELWRTQPPRTAAD